MAQSGVQRLQLARRQKARREAGLGNPNLGGQEKKSKKQVGFLLSKGSPLEPGQKAKLKRELSIGRVKVGR